jgi:hypothetical protein
VWRRLVAKVGKSNKDRTISLKDAVRSCTYKQTNKQSKQTNKQASKQTSKQTSKQANKQTSKQTNKQTNKQVVKPGQSGTTNRINTLNFKDQIKNISVPRCHLHRVS